MMTGEVQKDVKFFFDATAERAEIVSRVGEERYTIRVRSSSMVLIDCKKAERRATTPTRLVNTKETVSSRKVVSLDLAVGS